MLDLFANPGYLAAGGALVSSPIIIHLINRMRFKRLRWAAMEFLLKSQKRNRRRLIIEQLILLMLRCLLVILTGMLVARFVGFSLAGFVNQDSLHVVVLDDTLSMKDGWKEANQRKNSFLAAKEEVILKGIVKSLSQSTTNERLAIIPLSKLLTETDYEPVIYQRLNDKGTEDAIRTALEEMQPTDLHVNLQVGVEKARKLLSENIKDTRPVLHVVSDFRKVDWSGPGSDGLLKGLREAAESGVKLRLVDTAHPARLQGQGGVPLSHDNARGRQGRAGHLHGDSGQLRHPRGER
jgi:Aerotolerance regulator N-terminal